MTPQQFRIRRQAASNPLAQLWQALLPLRSVQRFMMTGAHPDDEASALLARLAKGDGAGVIYVSATRGGGGQNALGVEAGTALALIRTREMEAAAEVLGMELYWLELHADDPVSDFGFAKSPEQTLAMWGEDRALGRLVRAIRQSRPDVVSPAFLDVPGQHGHHRAIARMTLRAFEAAADPAAFPEQIDAGLRPWTIAKLYLPAYSGAGATYDDAAPPPPATLAVDVGGYDRWLGATHAQIGEWSRLCHRSQGMGRWRGETEAGPVALHLARTRLTHAKNEKTVFDGLPTRLTHLAAALEPPAKAALIGADEAIERAIAAFPDFDRVAASVHTAMAAIGQAQAHLAEAPADVADTVLHRLVQKRRQLARASRLALSLVPRLELPETVVLGEPGTARLAVFQGGPPCAAELGLVAEDGAVRRPDPDGRIDYIPRASQPFREHFDPLAANASVSGVLRYSADGVEVEVCIAPEMAPVPAPPLALAPALAAMVILDASASSIAIPVVARNHSSAPIASVLRLVGAAAEGTAIRLEPGESLETTLAAPKPAPGRHRWQLAADGVPHGRLVRQFYPHTGPTGWVEAAAIDLLVIDLKLPGRPRIGIVDGGSDRLGSWLRQLGLEVEPLAAQDMTRGDLGRFDTIVVGIKAFGSRADLSQARKRLQDFVEGGGHLLTQYHRPQDGWAAFATPPFRIAIGAPSVRWRVSDPLAPVEILTPDHPLLTYPNRIGAADWAGWQKERGLYFASSWDAAYVPLLALADAGEVPLQGGLISAEIGLGRHTHVSLALAHQLERLVPGAFRLIANLVQPARS